MSDASSRRYLPEAEFPERETTRRITGAFFYVHTHLGHGFLEVVYRRALAHVLVRTGLDVRREQPVTVRFEGTVVGEFRLDLVVGERVVVEVKAAERLHSSHDAQLLNYLRASDLPVGLLLNFGPKAEVRRLVLTWRRAAQAPCRNSG